MVCEIKRQEEGNAANWFPDSGQDKVLKKVSSEEVLRRAGRAPDSGVRQFLVEQCLAHCEPLINLIIAPGYS